MKQRDTTLQAFYDLTETAILRRADTCKNAGPAAKPVFDALRKNIGSQDRLTPERLPVCDALESALHVASTGLAPIPELAATLNDLSPRLQWKRRNSSPPDGTNFHDGHANALVAGPNGLEEREDVWVGISLLAPHVRYPDHRHHPEEVYVSLAGGAWWNANMEWTTPGPGGLIYNEPNVLHAMRTEAQPLLAIWCLWVEAKKKRFPVPNFSSCPRSTRASSPLTEDDRIKSGHDEDLRGESVRTSPAIPPAHENDSCPCNAA